MPTKKQYMARAIVASTALFLSVASPSVFATERGFYIGFSLGQSDIVNPERVDEFCATAGIVCGDEKKDTALQGFLGYQINNFFGAEVSLFDVGDPSLSTDAPVAATATVNVRGAAFSLLPQIPLGSVGAIFGRIGIAGGEVELVAEAPSIQRRESASASGATVLWGAGGAINLGRNVTIRAEWQRYAFDETLNIVGVGIDTPDINVYSAAVILRFPKK